MFYCILNIELIYEYNKAYKRGIIMRERTCCFTGHRRIPAEYYGEITRSLRSAIISMICRGVVYFETGGALGFDTMAAQAILELKVSYPQIKLILALPCKTQANAWKEKDRILYEKIKQSCDQYIYISELYTAGCMHKRNRWLVDSSKYCICYLKQPSGGTAYTVDYAKRQGLTVLNLATE